jgi:hypothetical protein
MHEAGDDVAVAVLDLKAGEEVGAVTLEGRQVADLKPAEDVPLGHKVAMLERTANGRLTAAEALRHDEFVLTKLYRSA